MRDLPSWSAIIDRYGLKLTRAGASLRGACPLHGGTNVTAFVITEGKGFYCHSCGENGGVRRFVQLMGDAAFAEPLGTECRPQARSSPLSTVRNESPAVISSQDALPEVAPVEPLDPFHPALRARGVSPELAAAFGCGFFNGHGSMHGRIVFPVHDATGRLVGHVGRLAGSGDTKYRLSRGLRKSLLLFNEHRLMAEGASTVIVVEGVFDVVAVAAAGTVNVVSPLGCQLSAEQVRRLRRYDRVWILFDDDDTGRSAAELAATRLGRRATVLHLPAADPANVRRGTLQSVLRRTMAMEDGVL